MKILLAILIGSIVLIAGCIGQSQPEPYTRLRDGSHCVEYTFKADIAKVLEVPVYNQVALQQLLYITPKFNILFESYPEDNPGFALASFAITNKLTIYNLQVHGRVAEFRPFDISNETSLIESNFYNRTGVDIVLLGPNTGSNSTAVKLVEKSIVVQGNDTSSIELAGERLALLMLEDLISNAREEQLFVQRCQT